jgi:hypothetical protein
MKISQIITLTLIIIVSSFSRKRGNGQLGSICGCRYEETRVVERQANKDAFCEEPHVCDCQRMVCAKNGGEDCTKDSDCAAGLYCDKSKYSICASISLRPKKIR